MRKVSSWLKFILPLCILGFLAAIYLGKVIINVTPSYPLGFYQMTNEPIAKGKMVAFCLASGTLTQEAVKRGYIQAGFCPSKTTVMIKRVFAATSDKVAITENGVLVNGKAIANSKPMLADSAGRPLPALRLNAVLGAHTFLLMSDYNPKSYDGRYFGLTDKANILSVIHPLWVW